MQHGRVYQAAKAPSLSWSLVDETTPVVGGNVMSINAYIRTQKIYISENFSWGCVSRSLRKIFMNCSTLSDLLLSAEIFFFLSSSFK